MKLWCVTSVKSFLSQFFMIAAPITEGLFFLSAKHHKIRIAMLRIREDNMVPANSFVSKATIDILSILSGQSGCPTVSGSGKVVMSIELPSLMYDKVFVLFLLSFTGGEGCDNSLHTQCFTFPWRCSGNGICMCVCVCV